MAIAVKCPSCGKGYQVQEKLAGKKVKCGCGNTMVVPMPPPASEGDLESLTPTNDSEDLGSFLDDVLPPSQASLPSMPLPNVPLPNMPGVPLAADDSASEAESKPKKKKLSPNVLMALMTVGGLLAALLFLLIVVLIGSWVMRPGFGSPKEVLAAYQQALDKKNWHELFATLDESSQKLVATHITEMALRMKSSSALSQVFTEHAGRDAGTGESSTYEQTQTEAGQLVAAVENLAVYGGDLLNAMEDAEEENMPRNPMMKVLLKKPRGEARRILSMAAVSDLTRSDNSAEGKLLFRMGEDDKEAVVRFSKSGGRWFMRVSDLDEEAAEAIVGSFDGFRTFP